MLYPGGLALCARRRVWLLTERRTFAVLAKSLRRLKVRELKNKRGTYGCVNDDGSGIIFGAVKPVHQRTCDKFRVNDRDRERLGDRLGR
jgi:hypothetical protein